MSEDVYTLYKMTKRLIERSEGCVNHDHSEEPLFKEWKNAIAIFDNLGRGYAERYEKEKKENAVV